MSWTQKTVMRPMIFIFIIIALVIVALMIYFWFYAYNMVVGGLFIFHDNEAKDAMLLVMPDFMLVNGQNYTDEERIKIIQEALKKSQSPEGQRLSDILNKTETARAALPPILSASSPVQFSVVNDTGKGDMLYKIPFTKPGQISIDIRSGGGELNIANNHSDWIPLSWSGNILFDGGTDQKSIGGDGWDRFIMDCPPGTPWGVTAQKDSESGLLEISVNPMEVDANGTKRPLSDPTFVPFGQDEETGEPYGIISISDICPPLS